MRLKRWGCALVVTVGMLALSGCGGGAPAEIPANRFSPYVALGDSYTAGPFIPVQSSDGCYRSSNNYPALLAAKLHAADFTDRSCGGARIDDLMHARTNGAQPQVDALTAGTRLVTIGVGGNDADIAATLYTKCLVVASRNPDGSPCRDSMQTPSGQNKLLLAMTGVTQRMKALLEEVHARAPHARVLVVGYPQSVPATGTCPDRLPIATGDYDYFREVIEGLNDALHAAARASDATWIDLWDATQGHDICSAQPWINGSTSKPGVAAALHPLAVEQRAVASLIATTLQKGGTNESPAS